MYLPRASKIIAGFVLAGIVGLAVYFLPAVQSASTASVGTGPISIPVPNPLPSTTGPFTVLLLGSDDDAKFPQDRVNTQSMILVRVDPSTKQATMLSVPRDLWVSIPGQGFGKISTAYQTGGPNAAVAAVESNFKVHIDDYVWIGLEGLVRLVNDLGGVDMLVTNPVMDDFYPSDINTTDPYGYYRVAVLPGAVHLDGVHALQYVRSRHGDLRGDFARSERQQQLLMAIKAKAAHLTAADFPGIASAMQGELKTTIGLARMRLLFSMGGDFTGSNVRRIVLLPPYTTEGFAGGQDVVYPNWGQILPVVHQSFP
ncbi:MAG TPA: LCP family protein [Candidatus Dormibacteraeota bacterium]